MSVTRRVQVRDAGDGHRYQLWVDDVLVGKCDYLGIEESLPEDLSGTVLDLMVRQGCQRTSTKAFLWRFVNEKKKREEAGGSLFFWGEKMECDR